MQPADQSAGCIYGHFPNHVRQHSPIETVISRFQRRNKEIRTHSQSGLGSDFSSMVEHRGVEPRLAHSIRSVSFTIVVPLHCRSRHSFVQPTSASFSLREQPTGLTLGSVPLHAIRKDCRGKKVQLHSSAQEKTVHKGRSFLVWSIGESNPWPLQCECSALPTVPMPHIWTVFIELVFLLVPLGFRSDSSERLFRQLYQCPVHRRVYHSHIGNASTFYCIPYWLAPGYSHSWEPPVRHC